MTIPRQTANRYPSHILPHARLIDAHDGIEIHLVGYAEYGAMGVAAFYLPDHPAGEVYQSVDPCPVHLDRDHFFFARWSADRWTDEPTFEWFAHGQGEARCEAPQL